MKVPRLVLCAVALLLLAGISYSQALSVGFGEIDYQAVEGRGGRYAVVQKTGENVADLVVTVTTLRFEELDPNEKPSEITSVPDPAEYEENGRKDFYQVVETLTFPPSMVSQDLQVFLPFYDDDINEEQEGYFAMVRVNASASDPQDVATLQYIRNGIALIIINDDDEIRLSFERDRYTVREGEGDGRYNELLTVCKEDDGLTERNLTVLIQMNELSGVEAATEGEDYEIESDFLRLTFQPEEQKMYIPFQVKDDAIAEYTERFNLFLSVPRNGGWQIGRHYTTNVYIEDNDVAVIGFEKEEYTVGEQDGSVDVCVKLFSPAVIELLVVGTVRTIEKTAQEEDDFQPIEEFLFIFNEEPRECFSIPIVNNNIPEAVETFVASLTLDRTVTRGNVIISRNTTTVIIVDDDEHICYENGINDTCTESNGCGECVEGYAPPDCCECELGAQDIYFLIDATQSNNVMDFCQTIYAVQQLTKAINPTNDIRKPRFATYLYPYSRTSPVEEMRLMKMGQYDCPNTIQVLHNLVEEFSYDVRHGYKVYGRTTLPKRAIDFLAADIRDENNNRNTRRRVVVVLTDGDVEISERDQLKNSVTALTDLGQITLIVAGLASDIYSAEELASFKAALTIIANGNEDNVILGRTSSEVSEGIVTKMAANDAICRNEAEEIKGKLRGNSAELYCYCIAPPGWTLQVSQCQERCVQDNNMTVEECAATPTCEGL